MRAPTLPEHVIGRGQGRLWMTTSSKQGIVRPYAARFVRDGVDSPMETKVRMLLVLAGLPEPEVNFEIRDENGDVLLRFDLAYRLARVAVEYEGRQHVEVIEAWERDITRRDRVDDAEWRVVSVIGRGVYVDPANTLDRVARALRSRGVAGQDQALSRWSCPSGVR